MPLSRDQRVRSLLGVIAAMAVVNLVYGISFPLLALVLDAQGVSKSLIGLNTVTQALAVIAIAPLTPGLLARHAPARLMQGSALGLALLFVLAGWFPNVWFWFPLRLLIGALTALLWIASEALINSLVVDAWRGRVISLYAAAGAAGFALGPALLVLTGAEGMLPFLATSAMVMVSALPLLLVVPGHRGIAGEQRPGLWRVLRLAPVIMMANLVYAAAVESMITFFPLFGLHLGLSQEFALGLLTITSLGGMLLILPLGWLADRVDRMAMLAVVTGLSIVGLVLMPFMVLAPPLAAAAFVFLFGGIEGMIYALGVTLVGQQFRGAALAAATTAFTTCWALGTIAGPLLAGAGMDWLGAETLPLIAAGFFLVFLPLPVATWWRSRGASRIASS